MNKKKILLIIISAVVLVAICATIGISGMFSPYERQIKLAYKLLEQGNYEEAILAFDKAIEIDVKRDKAYIGKADVYVSRCDGSMLEDVKAVLEIAYNQHYNDNNVVKALIRISNDLIKTGETNWALELLDFGYELTGDERILNAKENILKTFSEKFLLELSELFDAEDYETIYSRLISNEAVELIEMQEHGFGYVHILDGNGNTGKGIGLYSDSLAVEKGMTIIGYGMAYFGDFKEGKKVGNGIWIAPINDDGDYLLFKGEWDNDMPNGHGVWQDINDIEIWEADGNFVDGFIDGNLKFKIISRKTPEVQVFDYASANMGVLNEIDVESYVKIYGEAIRAIAMSSAEKPHAIGKIEGRELDPLESGYAGLSYYDTIFVYGSIR